MATITTHDLATLRGYWQGVDLTLGKDLGLYPTDALLQQQHDARESAKQGLLDALHEQGLLPQRVGRNASLTTMSAQLNRGVQRYLADSASALLGLQLEDWLDMATPVNVPGTHQEYPNWRRKLSRSLDSIFTDRYLERLIRDIDLRRGGPVPSRTRKTVKTAGDEKPEETKKEDKKKKRKKKRKKPEWRVSVAGKNDGRSGDWPPVIIKTGSTEPIVSFASGKRRTASWHPSGMTSYQLSA